MYGEIGLFDRAKVKDQRFCKFVGVLFRPFHLAKEGIFADTRDLCKIIVTVSVGKDQGIADLITADFDRVAKLLSADFNEIA